MITAKTFREIIPSNNRYLNKFQWRLILELNSRQRFKSVTVYKTEQAAQRAARRINDKARAS